MRRRLLNAAVLLGLTSIVAGCGDSATPNGQPASVAVSDSPTENLVHLLKSVDPNIRIAALESLGKQGSAAADARPAVEAMLNDPDEHVRAAAEKTLQRLKR